MGPEFLIRDFAYTFQLKLLLQNGSLLLFHTSEAVLSDWHTESQRCIVIILVPSLISCATNYFTLLVCFLIYKMGIILVPTSQVLIINGIRKAKSLAQWLVDNKHSR